MSIACDSDAVLAFGELIRENGPQTEEHGIQTPLESNMTSTLITVPSGSDG